MREKGKEGHGRRGRGGKLEQGRRLAKAGPADLSVTAIKYKKAVLSQR